MDEQTVALIRRARSVAAEIKSQNEELKEIVGKLNDLLPVGWKGVVDGVSASKRSSNRTFDPKAYYLQLSPEEKLSCLRTGLALIDEKLVADLAKTKGDKEQFMVAPEVDAGILKLTP